MHSHAPLCKKQAFVVDASGLVLHIINPGSLVHTQAYTLIQTTSGSHARHRVARGLEALPQQYRPLLISNRGTLITLK